MSLYKKKLADDNEKKRGKEACEKYSEIIAINKCSPL